MHLVLEQPDGEMEVDLRLLHPDATVSDFTALVWPDAPGPRGILVDGVRHGPDRSLADLGLVHGAHVAPTDGRSATESPSQVGGGPGVAASASGLTLATVGGPDSGQVAALRLGEPLVVGRSPDAAVTYADATMSSRHASIELDADGTVKVTDLGSTNGTFVDGARVSSTTVAASGSPILVGATQLQARTVTSDDRPAGSPVGAGSGGTAAFNRPPRGALPPNVTVRALPDPPAEARSAQGMGLAAMIIGPLLMGGVMVAIYQDIRFAAFMLLSPILGIGNWISSKRQSKKDNVSSARQHRAALVQLDQDLRADAETETAVREEALPDLAEVLRRACQPSMALWQRRPHHDDWLRLRAGLGTVPWSPLDIDPRQPRPDLDEITSRHGHLVNCPVEVDLSSGGVVGIVGDRSSALAMARALICQAAVHHGPADLPMAVAVAPDHAAAWDWVKWLPHLRDASGSGRLVARDRETAAALLGSLAGAQAAGSDRNKAASGPTLLLILDDVVLLEGRRSPARDLLGGTTGAVAGIVIAPSEDLLPAVCTTVITTAAAVGDIEVRQPHLRLRLDDVIGSGVTEHLARRCARALARFEDPELGVVGGGLPSMVRLLPLLGFDDVTAQAVALGWKGLPADPAPATPLGVGEDGVLSIDLATDGPHALIGGTTGSGKSELLRSMVAGMAARVDPDHLVFVLVDYKGGSAFDECARLPHTVGMVTDLDESLGERALASLEAELHHRERVLRSAEAQDLPAYLAAGSPAGPLPRLVVVIDEFATLATELPDFLGALVGISQRGRSLGVHLILATQRPQGAVNANIKANTNLRIALRVQDSGDSDDIIDRRDAADLSRDTPGRAYVRRGPGEVELVQSALSTAVASAGPTQLLEVVAFRCTPTDPPVATTATDDNTPSDLHQLVEVVREAFVASGADAPRQPWLPVLPDEVPYEQLPSIDLDETQRSGLGVVPLGMVDKPSQQRQSPMGWDTADGHLALIGMVGSGTTTALLTVARSIAEHHRPGRAHLYGLDFGSGELGHITDLPHCGTVVAASDNEGQDRLIRRLKAELERRRDLDAAGRASEPTTVVLVDGVAAFLAEHDGVEGAELTDTFARLVNEGPGVGILFVFTGDRSNALPHRLAGAVSQRFLLRLADPMDYAAIGVRLKESPRFPPGRGYRSDGLLVQLANPGSPADWAVEPDDGLGPDAVLPFPQAVTAADLRSIGAVGRVSPTVRLPVGLDEDHATVFLKLHDGEHALIAGAPRSGVSSTLVLLAQELRAVHAAGEGDFIVAAIHNGRSPLAACEEVDVSGAATDFGEIFETAMADERPWFFLIDDAPRVEDPAGLIANMVVSGRPGIHVIGGGQANDLRSGLGHWTRRLSRSGVGILLSPDLNADGDLLGVRLPRRMSVAGGSGRGFVVNNGQQTFAQMAQPAPADGPSD